MVSWGKAVAFSARSGWLKLKLKLIYDWRPLCPGVRHPSGTRDQFFFLLKISFRQLRVYYFVAPSLMRGRVCNLLYNCFWALPEQSLLRRSPAKLTAISYCLIWDSANLVRVRVRVTLQLTVSQSVCLGVEPNLGLLTREIFFFKVTARLFGDALSDDRSGLSFSQPGVAVGVLLAADSQSTSSSGYRASLWDPWPDFIFLEGQVPVFISPRDRLVPVVTEIYLETAQRMVGVTLVTLLHWKQPRRRCLT
jgi:hypothetical protein